MTEILKLIAALAIAIIAGALTVFGIVFNWTLFWMVIEKMNL